MAALNFPDNPTVGDTFTSGSVLWKWNGTTWVIASAAEATPTQPQPTIMRYSDLTNIAATRVPLPFNEQFGPDLVPGERYIVEMQASWRFGVGALSSVNFYGMDGANQIAYIQRYGTFESNERGDGSVSFVYTWVGPDPIPIMEATTSASTMQTNDSTGRWNIIKFTPYPS